jgi:hypothetical protein
MITRQWMFDKSCWNYRTAKSLRREADKIEKRERPPRPIDYPPQITADDETEIKKYQAKRAKINAEIDAEIKKLEERRRARQHAEWKTVLSSPTALRYVADQMDAHIDEAERNKRAREVAELLRRMEFQQRINTPVQDPLTVLNLSSSATPAEINARFRELVKRLHPDTNGGGDATNALFNSVVRAMDLLRAAGRA